MQQKEETNLISKISLIVAMVIFGFISYVRKNINLSSPAVSAFRGIIGGLCLFLAVIITKTSVDKKTLKKNILWLIISGILIAGDWVIFFDSFNYTTVATATLCYYMAPIFVLIVSPILFKERITIQKIVCIVVAFIGMVLVSGVIETGFRSIVELKGVFLALVAAVIYAAIILINKKIIGIPALLKTAIQISITGIFMVVYVLIFEDVSTLAFDKKSIIWLIIIGIVSTGLAYLLYFGSIEKLKAQTVSILSYLDPLIAVLVSYFILKENMSVLSFIGCALILLATILSEIKITRKRIINGEKDGKEIDC